MKFITLLLRLYTLPIFVVLLGFIIYYVVFIKIDSIKNEQKHSSAFKQEVSTLANSSKTSSKEEIINNIKNSSNEEFIKTTLQDNLEEIKSSTSHAKDIESNKIALAEDKDPLKNKPLEDIKANIKQKLIANIKANVANLRESPSTNSKIIAKLYKKDDLEVLQELNYWSKVKIRSKEGYVLSRLLVHKVEPKDNIKQDLAKEIVKEPTLEPAKEISSNKKEQEIPKAQDVATTKIAREKNKENLIDPKPSLELDSKSQDAVLPTINKDSLEVEVKDSLKQAFVNVSKANIRSKPSQNSRIIAKAPFNRVVNIVKIENDWVRIKYTFKNLHIDGYVLKDLIRFNP